MIFNRAFLLGVWLWLAKVRFYDHGEVGFPLAQLTAQH